MLSCSNSYARAEVNYSDSTRTAIISVAESFIGVEERTGRNDGEKIAFFLNKVGLKEHNPWCAAFLAAVYKIAGVNTTVTGWSKSCCPEDRIIYRIGEREKDIPIASSFWWSRDRGGHTGLIIEWPKSGSKFYTIEGNVNNGRKFGGVHKLVRSKNAVHLVADWVDSSSSSSSSSAPLVVDSVKQIDTKKAIIEEPPIYISETVSEITSYAEDNREDLLVLLLIIIILFRAKND